MITKSISFECITPCFCAGADQGSAEVRPSALRGALRWWFRALGGTPEQEIRTFGGGPNVLASAIQVRVGEINGKPVGKLPVPNQPTSPLAYILYFASIAGGQNANFGKGPRWNPPAILGRGTTFTLNLRQLRAIPQESLLNDSLVALSHYGSIGLRATRGMGAIQATDVTLESFARVDRLLTERGFTIRRSDKAHPSWEAVFTEAGKWLKGDLRKGEFGAGGNKKPPQATALGSIKPVRQTSAVYLRPIQLDGNLVFSAFEAPHHKVLGELSRRKHSEPVLKSRDFTQPPPAL